MASKNVKVVELPRNASTPAEVKSVVVDELNNGYVIQGIYTSRKDSTNYHWAIMTKRVTE